MFDAISEELQKAERVVFVTGAGISQESGIPTFRGKDGHWRRYDPMRLASIGAFYENPGLVWEWYEDRRRNIRLAEPNAGHRAIAELEERYRVCVLTQNIDGLHQRAGSSDVLELHGNITRTRCTGCGRPGGAGGFASLPPRCGCGAMLRPDVVWFGEPLPQDVWRRAIAESGRCDIMVIAGTSLAVSPANTLPRVAGQNGATLIEINPEETAMSYMMDVSIRDVSSGALVRLQESALVGRHAGSGRREP